MLEAALALAARGWPVFPCCPITKRPLTRRGFYDATLDESAIRSHWRGTNREKHMIGVPTGERIGAFVLDINPPEGMTMQICFSVLFDYGVEIANTRVTITPHGWHVWYKLPAGIDVRNRGKLLGGVIDCVRGTGGYVIVPPSINGEGREYTWWGGAPYEPIKAADAPPRLISLIV